MGKGRGGGEEEGGREGRDTLNSMQWRQSSHPAVQLWAALSTVNINAKQRQGRRGA